jgi:hypothetical protein
MSFGPQWKLPACDCKRATLPTHLFYVQQNTAAIGINFNQNSNAPYTSLGSKKLHHALCAGSSSTRHLVNQGPGEGLIC